MGYKTIGGIDEAGRGPLVGPVVTACVILPDDSFIPRLNDSKKLSEKVREELYEQITREAIAYSVGMSDNLIIDEINILNATKKAMMEAYYNIPVKPDFVLTDAVKLEKLDVPSLPIIKGDAKSVSIAAASIIAKVTRDRMMREISELYPEYNFEKNKGYGTKEHIEALMKIGPCPLHRKTFIKNFIA